MKKLTGTLIAAALTLTPASPAFADRSDDRDKDRSARSSSCTLDLGAITRAVNVQAFCGPGHTGRSSEGGRASSSCNVALDAASAVELQALCASERTQRNDKGDVRNDQRSRRRHDERGAKRGDENNIQLSSCITLGVLRSSVSLQALCGAH